MKEPRILILDDATSSVDADSEKQIQDALRDALGEGAAGRTTFIVGHRLSTILLADRMAVLEGGRVIEVGSHHELVDAGGRYAEMYGPDERGRGEDACMRRIRAWLMRYPLVRLMCFGSPYKLQLAGLGLVMALVTGRAGLVAALAHGCRAPGHVIVLRDH